MNKIINRRNLPGIIAAVKYQALMAPPVILKFPPRVADGNKTFRYLRVM